MNQVAMSGGDASEWQARLKFMRISADTGRILREFWNVLEPQLPVILEGFYKHVTSEPKLARLIGSDIPRLKAAQGSHWQRLFSGRFDEEYQRGVRTIGFIHNKIGLEPRWYIGGYNFVLSELDKLAVRSNRWRSHRLGELLTAINCAVMLDMDMAISVYQEAMLADRQQRQDRMFDAIKDFDAQVTLVLNAFGTAATGLQETAQSLAVTAEETGRQSSVVAAASEEASTNVQTVATAAEELASSISEIGRQVANSVEITERAVEDAGRTNEKIQGLASAAKSIGDVVKLISDIANQTNLLALNAAIEAARAGVAGKGFAVVAADVKALAGQTAKATDEIRGKIAEMQAATGHSVEAIDSIAHTITRINEISTAIASAVEQQRAATQEIARNVQEASTGTTEVSMNIVGVTQAANDTGVASTQVLGSAGSLSEQSQSLRHRVDDFLEKIRAA